MRATFAVPEGETAGGRPLVAGDLTVGGVPLEFGGQVAGAITMRLTGVAGGKGTIPVARPALRAVTPMATEPVLALDEIQGNSVVGFRKGNQSFAFLRVDAGDGAVDRARSWLRGLGSQLSDARQVLDHNRTFRAARQGDAAASATLGAAAPVVWVNVALTAACLVRFGLDVREFDDDGFRVGLAKRSPLLNDPADPASSGHPGRWQVGGRTPAMRSSSWPATSATRASPASTRS